MTTNIDAVAVLREICDMQAKHYGDGMLTHLALIDLAKRGREALAATERAATQPAGEVVYAILYDESDKRPVVVLGEEAARATYKRIGGQGFNAHLFVKLESNSRDDPYYDCNLAAPISEDTAIARAKELDARYAAGYSDGWREGREAPVCAICNDSGTYCTGTSGQESDGNAPILERCECDAGLPTAAPSVTEGDALPPLPKSVSASLMLDGYTADQMRAYGQACHALGRGAAVREYVDSGSFAARTVNSGDIGLKGRLCEECGADMNHGDHWPACSARTQPAAVEPAESATQPEAAARVVDNIEQTRANFEDWYVTHIDDAQIGSADCAARWSAWLAGSSGCYKALGGWKIAPLPWNAPTAPAAPDSAREAMTDAEQLVKLRAESDEIYAAARGKLAKKGGAA